METKIDKLRDLIIQMSKQANMEWFFDTHTSKVAAKAEWLLKRLPEANPEIVMAAVWLHDIYYLVDLSKEEQHAALGAHEARKLLPQYGFSEEIIEGVAHAIRAHSCKDVIPETLEAKILATADAMSHFTPEFYLSIAMFGQAEGNQNMSQYFAWAKNKLERDFNSGKILFDFAKEAVAEDYAKIKAFFSI